MFFEQIMDNPIAKVTKLTHKKKSKAKPFPLNTIEFQKLASRKLRIGSAKAMEIAEKLYNKGYISYPRTETNIFPEMNLKEIVEELAKNDTFGYFAKNIINDPASNYGPPKKGRLDDKAHPPIHPVKNIDHKKLEGSEWRIYELVCRHFLACLSREAVGNQTKMEVDLGGEIFRARGLSIVDAQWLDVYSPYEKWADTVVPPLEVGDTFEPTLIEMAPSQTQPPKLLSEADLISKMDLNGIGTDATIHEHIKTIQERGYARKEGQHFRPTAVGLNLVKAYEYVGIELYKPSLRSQMEKELKLIASGEKKKETVLRDCLKNMRKIFKQVQSSVGDMRAYLDENYTPDEEPLKKVKSEKVKTEIEIIPDETLEAMEKLNPFEGANIKAEDFFKSVDEIKKIRLLDDLEEDKLFEQKSVLNETDFMTCDKCNDFKVRVKMSNDGYLFAACNGFPRCKNAFHTIPKCIRNIALLDEQCQKCLADHSQETRLFQIAFFSSGIKAIKEICQSVDYKFCIYSKCDKNLEKIKFLAKALKIPPKKGTFKDEMSAEELSARKEFRQKYIQKQYDKKGGGKKRNSKNDFKQGFRKTQNPESGDEESFEKSKFKNYNLYQRSKQDGEAATSGEKRKGTACQGCGKMRHTAKSSCKYK